MSGQEYHWEALRKQRVIDKKYAEMRKLAEEEKKLEEAAAQQAASERLQSQTQDHKRRQDLAQQIQQRDRQGIQKSYQERERQIQCLVSEREWHDELIASLNQKEKDELLRDLLRDHKQKSKVLRDHGLYRGDAKFFIDPQYN